VTIASGRGSIPALGWLIPDKVRRREGVCDPDTPTWVQLTKKGYSRGSYRFIIKKEAEASELCKIIIGSISISGLLHLCIYFLPERGHA